TPWSAHCSTRVGSSRLSWIEPQQGASLSQTTQITLHDPVLLAVWPGMGSVALVAGSYLAQQLGARRVAELDASEYFQIETVDIRNGLATIGQPPRSIFFEWRD